MYDGDDKWPETAPVGTYPAGASPFGLQDVAGNVWEWVGDWYAPYEESPAPDPTGPEKPGSLPRRVIRGGSWGEGVPSWVRAAYRRAWIGGSGYTSGVGFRCAGALLPAKP
jgi:formylglycine-generating enzyme required for sulfatase activity